MVKIWFILILIVILAFCLRIYRIDQVPPSLNWDEVSIGYNAYSVLKTGRDEWGELFPIHFKSYGEYKLPVQVYISIPGIWFFGLNEFGVRVTPVVYGSLTIIFVFLLSKRLFKSDLIGLISAFLVAISPWHIQLTRASFEASLAVLWVVVGIWLLLKGMGGKKINWFLAMIFFALAIYTYNSARVFVPLMLIWMGIVYFRDFRIFWKRTLASLILLVLFMIPLVPFILSGEGGARYKLVSVVDDPGLIPRVNEARGNSTLPPLMARLVHSQYTYTVTKVISNYLSHFDPRFLFINGASHKQHHSQVVGEMFLVQAPFFVTGIILLIFAWKKSKQGKILLGWICLAFIPVAVTNDSIPHALRTLNAMPALNIVTAFGFVKIWDYFRIRFKVVTFIAFTLIIVCLLGQFGWYYYNYQMVYPILYSRDWQFGYKEVVDFVTKHQDEYDLVVFSRHYGEPHMFTLFFSQYDPKNFQNDPKLNRFETNDWVRVLRFDKYYFPDLGDVDTKFEEILKAYPNKKILFIGRDVDFPSTQTRLSKINFLDKNNAFSIVEVK